MAPVRRLPPASWLLTFEAVARAQSFSRAAQVLGTTQPAVSQRMTQLEAFLGLALFRRLARGVVPTAEGLRLLAALGEGLDLIEAALDELRASGRQQRLTVITDFGFAAFWLLPRLGSLRTAAPELDVRVLTTQAQLDPRREPVDLAIAFGSAASWPGCSVEPLFPEIVQPVSGPALWRAHPPPRSLAELAALPLVHLESGGSDRWLDWPGWLRAAGGIGAEPERGLTLDNYILVLQAAIAGQGIALGWRPLTNDLLRSGQLVPALDRTVRTASGYHMVRARGGARPATRLFDAWLRRQLAAGETSADG